MNALGLGGRQVDLVDDRNDFQIVVQGQIGVRERLRFNALRGVHHQQRALARLQAARHFVSEIDVTRRVDQIQLVQFAVVGAVIEADRVRFDGDAALAFQVHRIENLRHHLALRQRASGLEQAVGERRLAVVDVRDDRKIPDESWIHAAEGPKLQLSHTVRHRPAAVCLKLLHMTEKTAWRNPVRVRLEAGEPVFALTITTNNVEIAALGATLGFHFLWVEMEHSPITLETLRSMVLAARSLPAMVFARVPVIELWTAKRVLDQGVTGVIFPFTSTPELAARAAKACRYPPVGLRGSGPGLAMTCWPDTGSYHDSADANVLCMCVIEEACAVERIDEIAATPGIDVLFIGTSDLSFSLGLRGRQNEPLLEEAIAKIVAAAKRHGKFVGRPAMDSTQVPRYREQGFQLFQCTTELNLMRIGAKQWLEQADAPAPRPRETALY